MSSTHESDFDDGRYCIAYRDVLAAAQRIQGTVHETPVWTSVSVDALVNRGTSQQQQRRVFFKVEALQKTGSFKFRGALNAVRSILEEEEDDDNDDDENEQTKTPRRKRDSLHVITHSSGNHAQALALAAKLSSTVACPVRATIVMPENTPTIKRQAVQDFGADIVLVESTNEARQATTARLQAETGATLIHPSEDPRVIAGQGTVCLELLQQLQRLQSSSNGGGVTPDAVIIPVGGGGLAAGNCITLRAVLGDEVQIILAEPETLNDAQRSFAAGQLLGHAPEHLPLTSVADGLKTTLGPHTWPVVRDLATAVLTVSEAEVVAATRLVWERLKVCIEPSAGVGVAVLLSDAFATQFPDCRNVAVILCGGNVDIPRIANLMTTMTKTD